MDRKSREDAEADAEAAALDVIIAVLPGLLELAEKRLQALRGVKPPIEGPTDEETSRWEWEGGAIR